MARRFNDTGRWKALRKLEASLKNLYNYCWDMSDASGVYELDWDYLKADIGKQYKDSDFDILEKEISTFKKIGPGKFIFIDFILINYGKLREGYNPHKPVFRDIEKNKLTINSSLNQACFKLEEEEEDKDEYEEEDEEEKGGVGEKENEAILYPIFEDFWNEYDKKVGDKEKIKRKWQKLRQDEKEKIMGFIPDYKLSQPDKQFRKNPETFLNNKTWNDELINQNGKQTSKTGYSESSTYNPATRAAELFNEFNATVNSKQH